MVLTFRPTVVKDGVCGREHLTVPGKPQRLTQKHHFLSMWFLICLMELRVPGFQTQLCLRWLHTQSGRCCHLPHSQNVSPQYKRLE